MHLLGGSSQSHRNAVFRGCSALGQCTSGGDYLTHTVLRSCLLGHPGIYFSGSEFGAAKLLEQGKLVSLHILGLISKDAIPPAQDIT